MNHNTTKFILQLLESYSKGVDGITHITLRDMISFSCGDESVHVFLKYVINTSGVFTLNAEPGVVMDKIIKTSSDTPDHLHG